MFVKYARLKSKRQTFKRGANISVVIDELDDDLLIGEIEVILPDKDRAVEAIQRIEQIAKTLSEFTFLFRRLQASHTSFMFEHRHCHNSSVVRIFFSLLRFRPVQHGGFRLPIGFQVERAMIFIKLPMFQSVSDRFLISR